MKRQILFFLLMLAVICFGVKELQYVSSSIQVLNPNDSKDLPIYSVETSNKYISLTFDTAWGNEDMKEILSILDQEQVKATFFFSGDWVSRYPNDIKRIAKKGHDLGNHGNYHKHMPNLSLKEQREEILKASEKIKAITGEDVTLFRAPYGDYNEQVVRNARILNHEVIQWDVDSLDWKEYGVKDMTQRVCNHKNLRNGSIILLHTGTKYTKKALKLIIRKLRKKGYEFVPVSKLIYKHNFYVDEEGRQRKK